MSERSPRRPPTWLRIVAAAVAVSLLAALPYLAAGVGGTFIRLDDEKYVTGNRQVLQGLSLAGARWALTTLHFVSWHPLTWLSHMLDVTLFGLDARGHHATSLLLHALNTGLLFLALWRMTGACARSAIVAALFGTHPFRVESVAWISTRKDVLSGLCFMLAVLAWERYARRGGGGRYLTALALCALGLASKAMLVTLPLVLLLLDIWPLGRVSPRRGGGVPRGWPAILLEKVPFLALAAASSLLTMQAHRLEDKSAFSLGARLANVIVSYKTYLAGTLWPFGLAVYYPFPAAPIPWVEIAASALLLGLLTLAALRRASAQPFLAIGWAWFLWMLAPVIGFVMIGPFSRADRYTYLPQIGLFIGATWLAAGLVPPGPKRRRPTGLPLVAIAVVAAFAAASAVQAGYWRDSGTVFRRSLAVTKDNWAMENGLGTALAELGRHEQALPHYREALRINPNFAKAHSNLCNSLAALGRAEEAAAACREAVRIDPDLPEARRNLGYALAALADYEEALAQYHEAVRLDPDNAETRYNIGVVLAALKRHEEAVAQYREAIRADPQFPDALSNLGNSLVLLGRYEEAESSFREAIRLAPDHAASQAGLSWLARRRGAPRR